MNIGRFRVFVLMRDVLYKFNDSNFAHKIYHCAHTISYVRSLIWFFALIF